MKSKPLLEGAGFAALYALPLANAFFNSWHVDSFHHAQPVGSIPRAILLFTLLVWALAWLVIAAADRLPRRGRHIAGLALSAVLVWLLGRIGAGIFGAQPAVGGLAAHIGLAVVPIIMLTLWRLRPSTIEHTLRAVHILFAAASFGMLVLLPKLAFQALRFQPREQTSFIHPSPAATAPAQPRIVWIVMDELSYDQIFEHRPSGLHFPNFENFARNSVSFSDLQPTGYHTEEVLPGLLLGEPVADVEHIYGRPFRFRSVDRGSWHSYNPSQTIFGDARRLGWTTGLAGWFNPYCRFLHTVLDRCSWQFSDQYPGLPGRLSYNRSTLRNLLALLPPHERMAPLLDTPADHQSHLRDYVEVMAQAESLLRDQRIRFIMLHLPVPHTPGIYDRTRHALAAGGNYIDNLVLADDTLGRLISLIQSTPHVSQTSIILSSDHSWRVDVWKTLPDWTPEEGRLSGERFDPRPVLLVHLPGGEDGRVVSRPVSAMIVHPILEAMLHGQLHSYADLAALTGGQQKDQ